MLVAGLDRGLLPVPESMGLLGLAVDFDGGGADLVDAADVGLLFSDADLLVIETTLLVPCPALLGALTLVLRMLNPSLRMMQKNLMQTVLHQK